MSVNAQWKARVDAMVCTDKRAYQWHWEADETAQRHASCQKCTPNRRMHSFQCPANPTHWHIGHGGQP